jgi:rod shape-determining protein MreD
MVLVRGLISFVAVTVAVILQLTIVDRIAFPGGTGPDLVLLAVAALALASGPMIGVLTGFWGGLALDVAPPGSHFVGQNALVFCLIGYLCGLAADVPNSEGVPEQGHTALFEIVVTAVGAVCGEALASLLGAMLSDPRMTWSAIRHVLPVAAVYDVLLCPFVLYAAAALLRLAGTPRSKRNRAAWAAPATRNSGSHPPGLTQNAPRLRLAERGKGEGLGGGLRTPPPAKREPRLKLDQSGSLGAAFATGGSRRGPGLGSGLGGGTMTSALGGGAAKVRFAARRGEGVLGGALNSNRARLDGSRFGPSRMGRSLLGGSVFSRSPSALRASALPKKTAPIGRSSFLGRSPFLTRSPALSRPANLARPASLGRAATFSRSTRRTASLMRSAPGGSATGYGPRARRLGLLARLAGALTGSARRQPRLRSHQRTFRTPIRTRSPGRGWLRGSSLRGGATMGRGWTGGRAPRLHMPRRKSKKRWRTGGYR